MLQGRPSPSSTSHSRPKAPSATTTPRSTLLAISTCEQHDDHHIKLIANLISGTFFSEFLTLTDTRWLAISLHRRCPTVMAARTFAAQGAENAYLFCAQNAFLYSK